MLPIKFALVQFCWQIGFIETVSYSYNISHVILITLPPNDACVKMFPRVSLSLSPYASFIGPATKDGESVVRVVPPLNHILRKSVPANQCM